MTQSINYASLKIDHRNLKLKKNNFYRFYSGKPLFVILPTIVAYKNFSIFIFIHMAFFIIIPIGVVPRIDKLILKTKFS